VYRYGIAKSAAIRKSESSVEYTVAALLKNGKNLRCQTVDKIQKQVSFSGRLLREEMLLVTSKTKPIATVIREAKESTRGNG
jgi:hypothetical protein